MSDDKAALLRLTIYRTGEELHAQIPFFVEMARRAAEAQISIVRSQPAKEFYTRCMDHFDRLYAESKHSAKFMSIAVHPYISGVPYRIKYFEQVFETLRKKPGVAFWTGEQIMDWYLSSRKKGRSKR